MLQEPGLATPANKRGLGVLLMEITAVVAVVTPLYVATMSARYVG
jgi:hypothetical protein